MPAKRADFATFHQRAPRSVAAVFDYLSRGAGALRRSSVRGARRRSLLCGRARRAAAQPVGRDSEPAGRPARRRRERGDRRPGPRRRRLGLRVRQRARHRERARHGEPCVGLRARRAGQRTTARSRRSSRYRPSTERRSSRTPSRSPLADKVEQCLRAERAMQHDDVKVTAAFGARHAGAEAVRLLRRLGIEQEIVECGAGIDAMAARRGHHADPQLPERARRLERAGRLGVRRVARARARGAARRPSRPRRCSVPTRARPGS